MTAEWLERHLDIEVISRDRCGSFAQGAREGAPQARQIADRFHILQNLREAIQAQLSRTAVSSARPLLPADGDGDEAAISCSAWDKYGGAEHRRLTRMTNQRSRQASFDRVRALRRDGRTISDIVQQTGVDRRTIAKWIRADALPQRNASAPKTTSLRYFEDYLSRRWSEGCVRARRLFQEIKTRGYTGSFSNLERLFGEMAQSKTQRNAACADGFEGAAFRSSHGAVDLADRGCGTVHQAARTADRQSGGESGRAEKRLARVRSNASPRHAISGRAEKQERRRSRRLDERCPALGSLRNATVRPHIAEGRQRREKCDHRALERCIDAP